MVVTVVDVSHSTSVGVEPSFGAPAILGPVSTITTFGSIHITAYVIFAYSSGDDGNRTTYFFLSIDSIHVGYGIRRGGHRTIGLEFYPLSYL